MTLNTEKTLKVQTPKKVKCTLLQKEKRSKQILLLIGMQLILIVDWSSLLMKSQFFHHQLLQYPHLPLVYKKKCWFMHNRMPMESHTTVLNMRLQRISIEDFMLQKNKWHDVGQYCITCGEGFSLCNACDERDCFHKQLSSIKQRKMHLYLNVDVPCALT